MIRLIRSPGYTVLVFTQERGITGICYLNKYWKVIQETKVTNKSSYLGGTAWTGQARNKAPQGMHTLMYALILCVCLELRYSNWDSKYNTVDPLLPRAEVNSTELQKWTTDKLPDADPDKTAASSGDSGIIHLPQNQRALKKSKDFFKLHASHFERRRANDVKHTGTSNLNLGKCYEERRRSAFSP